MAMKDTRLCPHCNQRMDVAPIVEHIIGKGFGCVGDIKMLVRGRIEATDKQVYNALGQLTRKGRIRHVGRGQYAPPR